MKTIIETPYGTSASVGNIENQSGQPVYILMAQSFNEPFIVSIKKQRPIRALLCILPQYQYY